MIMKNMKKVTLYTGNLCAFCFMAKKLLEEKNIEYTEFNVHNDERKKKEMLSISNGQTTVPQIFFGERHIGGYTNLEELNKENLLFKLLEE